MPTASKKRRKVVHCSGHMDKQPMILVHTCGTSGEGEEKTRRYAKMKEGRLDVRMWSLK
jgi:hypothetical protein